MRLYRILKKPIVTEKSSALEVANNTYVFEVSKDATKIDIKKAILELYGVSVSSVNILNTRMKFKFGKKGMQIRKRTTKKAYVTLADAKATIDVTLVK
ncbi:MAG: 50S ribosomal protein L23 [Candidatus Gracilibacteria bacterium]|nr:50S ribosomal protein L23 [Candidatus Gracilibacteria bacterium]